MVKKRGRPPKKTADKEVANKAPSFYSNYKKYIWTGILLILVLIFAFAFLGTAGSVGNAIEQFFYILLGNTVFIIPVIFLFGVCLLLWKNNPYKEKEQHIVILSLLLFLEFATIWAIGELNSIGLNSFDWGYAGIGGWIGYLIAWPLLNWFGFWVTLLTFIVLISITIIILLDPLFKHIKQKRKEKPIITEEERFKKEKRRIQLPIIPIIKKKEVSKTGKEEKKEEFIPIKTHSKYKIPPLKLLSKIIQKPESGDIQLNSDQIKKTLHNFGIPVSMDEVYVGPTVSQYTLKPAQGVKLSKITNLSNNLALDLATSSIRIEAPIPGKALVGIEIPNKKRVSVGLREMLGAKEFYKDNLPLLFALGKDVKGDNIYADLADMPHLLVAGTTGSGKSICLNCIILSLLYRNSPEDMKIVLIDPKKVEFPVFDSIDHLLCPVISSADETIVALKWLVGEMERRFAVLKNAGNRDVGSYNKRWKEGMEKIPYIIVVMDELADLMMSRGKELENYIVRLAQKARAVGIHLILATQRPSVEVITGLIKANISSRIGLKVASQIDSRTMIDSVGAEKLLGKGDLLFSSKDSPKPRRIQGPFVSEKEIKDVVDWIIEHQEKAEEQEEGYLELEQDDNSLKSALEEMNNSTGAQMDRFLSDEDPLYNQAKQVVIQTRKASTSYLQRKLGVGYSRAARLIDSLEERGIVGPQEGSRARKVYVQEEE